MGWIAMIVIGLLAGLIAKAIMPGKDPGGAIITILLGIVGAVIGGVIRNVLNIGGRGDNINDPGFFMTLIFAVLGALVVLVVYRLLTGRSIRA
ncbi:MAG TPA: GlsB/YeaQ/YmgE family stress response membrane protein [Pyrinomonadaceae bacterium]|nr:GlsB/YeaQ/YmgE family stress response membrane protein [Pyrinomonadaceae bacterium]